MSLALQSFLPYPNSCLGTSPHQQGRDTKMAMLSFCGVDVSKDRLDVVVLPEQQCSSVGNDAAGWVELVEQLRGFSISAIGLEASGGYERGVVRILLAAGMSVRQINPFKLRQFAKASGVLERRESRRRECLQTAARCHAAASFSPPHYPGSAPTSRSSMCAWSRSSRPMPGSLTATGCSLPCRASDRCWPAR